MKQHDLVVIGAGPGGYVAAIRAAQLGLNVGCIDDNVQLGGTCLRIGCIPSKAMLESSELFHEASHSFGEHGIQFKEVSFDLTAMLRRKDRVVKMLTGGVASLFKKHNITRYQGRGRIPGPGRVVVEGGEVDELEARNIIIATGSSPATLPGVAFDGERIGSSTQALSYSQVPEHLVVIGAGYIGLEMGSVWRRLGSKVTVLEFLDRILPSSDRELADEAFKQLQRQGMEFRLGSRVTAVRIEGERCIVECDGQAPVECDRVLMAVGRRPNTDGLGLEQLGMKLTPKGFVHVGKDFATSLPGIFAIGDVIGGAMLAHKAEEEGIACVERIATGYGHVDYGSIPAVVYIQPELASVGRTEEALQEAGIAYRKGVFPFRGNGRARTLGQVEGKVKVLADAATDRVLGVHILGPRAGDMIAEAAVAMAFGASSEDIARACHAHPTLAEALKEAAMAVDDRPIHI